jgi:hypothetical protein
VKTRPNPRFRLLDQSSSVRSTTSPAALPTTIGEGDLSSRLTDEELERPAVKEFSSAYTHDRQMRLMEKQFKLLLTRSSRILCARAVADISSFLTEDVECRLDGPGNPSSLVRFLSLNPNAPLVLTGLGITP